MRQLFALMFFMSSTILACAQSEFGNAKWIALEHDSTIIFPYIHLLGADTKQGESLKQYKQPLLSKRFRLKGEVEEAKAYICGLGQYELFINGNRIGDYFLSPGWTMYNKRLLYNDFDVLEYLEDTSRIMEVKVILGGGMYDIPVVGYHKFAGSCGAPKLLFALHVTYTNGITETFVSDETWTAEESQVRYSSIYAGEHFDGSFKGTMQPVVVTKPNWDVPLVKQQKGSFVKIRQELPSRKISENLYDIGQNCSGIIRIKVKGERGKSITLRPAEILKDGKLYQRCAPGYKWKYTLEGSAAKPDGEEWQPRFSYTGFRYVEVIADKGVELLELTGLHTTTDAPEAGTFECSDTLFNQIHALIDWAIRSNLVSITTDCPTREKLGWQEQNHLMAYSMMYRYDMHILMNKIADDLADSQHDNGAIPTIAPEYTVFQKGSGFEDTPEWGASFILCPYYTYLWYGDVSVLKKHYEQMKRYISYLELRTQDGILNYGLGDWFDIGPRKPGRAQLTSVSLSATAMYYYELCTMQKIARILGKENDATNFSAKASFVKNAFNEKFYNAETHLYEQGSQTGLAMALYMNLVTDSTRQITVDALIADIEKRNYALTAGDVGFRYVIQALQQNGRSDVIYKMNTRDDIPGYAYQLKKGATALTESWQAYDNVSNNHMMLGHIMEWLYSGLGGISQSEEGCAWQHIVINPQMVGDITWVKTSYNAPNGKISCDWTRNDDSSSWTINLSIPKGSDAEIHLPDGRIENVTSGNYSFKSVVETKKYRD